MALPRSVRRALRAVLVLAAVLATWGVARRLTRPRPPRPDDATFAQAARVRVLRDTWGVPHVYGESDADAAFGLAYAHAEDDWPTLQAVLAASRGRLSLLSLSRTALANDYYASLVDVREEVDATYDALSPAFRAVLDGYARGLTLYAYLHPDESDGRLPPFTGKDVAAAFAHKIPIMVDVPRAIEAVRSGEARRVGDSDAMTMSLEGADAAARAFPGSNGHAVSRARSADGVARLNVNSHQPWEGPVAWYEAQVVSGEGWNMTGGTFPGAPLILHGHNEHLGWAHTVNSPDLVDVYALAMNPDPKHPHEYLFDGAYRPLDEKDAEIAIDTGLFTLTVKKRVYRSVHGPVLETDHGFFAIRYAGMGRRLRAGEQWFRMNKAASLAEWKDAMRMQAIPMFNCVYADADHVLYVYNALLPVRGGAYDYARVLPGDRADALWSAYLPFDDLPQVEDPPSGFVLNTNSTPFAATAGAGNPDPARYPKNLGIETNVNNRAARSLALLGGDAPITRDAFLAMKWDRTYAKDAAIYRDAVIPVLASARSRDGDEARAVAILRAWDGTADASSAGATLAILTWRALAGEDAGAGPRETSDPEEALRRAVAFLKGRFGKVDVPWGDVQRLRRGATDLALSGGPDVINGVYSRWDGDHERLVGYQGDSYVLEVELAPGGVTSRSIHQYGDSNRPGSAHYADQAPLYVRRELKPTLRTEREVREHLEREYHPGEEAVTPSGRTARSGPPRSASSPRG